MPQIGVHSGRFHHTAVAFHSKLFMLSADQNLMTYTFTKPFFEDFIITNISEKFGEKSLTMVQYSILLFSLSISITHGAFMERALSS